MFNPIQVVGISAHGQPAKKKERDPRSVELIYAQSIVNNPAYRRRDGALVSARRAAYLSDGEALDL